MSGGEKMEIIRQENEIQRECVQLIYNRRSFLTQARERKRSVCVRERDSKGVERDIVGVGKSYPLQTGAAAAFPYVLHFTMLSANSII